jgi:hypothetical protein
MRKLSLLILALPLTLTAQKRGKETPPPDATRATLLKTSDVYVAPDANSQKVSTVTPGHEVLIVERSGPWVKVFANTDVEERTESEDEPEFSTDAAAIPRSGWVRDKGIVGPNTPNGDRLIYGMAASMEAAASEPHAPKSAAGGAHLLYRRVAEYFPASSLAGESQWRSADIRWQEEKFDAATLPSAKDEAFMRPQLYQKALQKIVKTGSGKYPALAAYDLIDQKLCGDWQGLPKCPEMEAGLYSKYADQFPDGPKTPEALWNAAYRQGVLVTMYTAAEDKKRADVAAQRAHGFRDQLVAKFPNSDYTARAVSLVYRVEQGIAVYGSDRD